MSTVITSPLPWQLTWRQGIAPQFSSVQLNRLMSALESDDTALVQGGTTVPPPLQVCSSWLVEGCCALCFALWEEGSTVGELEEAFARACFETDRRLGEPAACRWFLNWFDDTPREEMRRELLAEVQRTLGQREAA